MVLLLLWVSSLAHTISRKNGEIELLKDKLSTSQSINEGLKDSVEKLIKYNECIAKIFIAPRSSDKAISGDVNDPVTALERCRVEVGGVPVSENPPPNPQTSQSSDSPPPNNQTVQSSTSQQNTNGGGEQPPDEPEPPQSIIPFVEQPIIGCPIAGVCI